MKLLVCVDGSEHSDKAVKFASRFAKNYRADITLLHVIKSERSSEKPVFDDYGEETRRAREIVMNGERIVSKNAPEITVISRIIAGPISNEIVRIAEEEQFNAVWIGTRGRNGIARMLMGSVADDVIRYAHCPVVLVR